MFLGNKVDSCRLLNVMQGMDSAKRTVCGLLAHPILIRTIVTSGRYRDRDHLNCKTVQREIASVLRWSVSCVVEK